MNLAGCLFRKDYLHNPLQAPASRQTTVRDTTLSFHILPGGARQREMRARAKEAQMDSVGEGHYCCAVFFFFLPSRGTDLFIQALTSSILTLPVSLLGSVLYTRSSPVTSPYYDSYNFLLFFWPSCFSLAL